MNCDGKFANFFLASASECKINFFFTCHLHADIYIPVVEAVVHDLVQNHLEFVNVLHVIVQESVVDRVAETEKNATDRRIEKDGTDWMGLSCQNNEINAKSVRCQGVIKKLLFLFLARHALFNE